MNKILNAIFGLSSESGEAAHADIVEMLKADHRRVSELFAKYEQLPASATREKRKVLREIFAELDIHTKLEEELVYPEVEGAEEHVTEAKEEHHVIDLIIAEIKKVRAMDEKTDAKVKVLKEMIEHHVKEEEWEMLPRLPQDELEEIGAKVKVRREELLGKEFPEKNMERAGVQPVEELYGGSEAGELVSDKPKSAQKSAAKESATKPKEKRTRKKNSAA
ncbi:MAG TPA: hemerythrin domain-containing protein [Candidatus Melainabacteria bacterium]|jgi:hemerythrin superfamily protein|nr:hemerythrin domain-containing protein [Candidatus Melainabacteria bacterium]HIN63478.1 hemerythrin domain-containing protein [Candidatus Obscuribacterales bacterium]